MKVDEFKDLRFYEKMLSIFTCTYLFAMTLLCLREDIYAYFNTNVKLLPDQSLSFLTNEHSDKDVNKFPIFFVVFIICFILNCKFRLLNPRKLCILNDVIAIRVIH